ncbi:hypothetical protein DYB28_008226, partial [Aphanomyces astaci]
RRIKTAKELVGFDDDDLSIHWVTILLHGNDPRNQVRFASGWQSRFGASAQRCFDSACLGLAHRFHECLVRYHRTSGNDGPFLAIENCTNCTVELVAFVPAAWTRDHGAKTKLVIWLYIKLKSTTISNEAWDVLPSGYDDLRTFRGRLASVLANTTAVESDFSILKWELEEFRSCMMHLSLECIFQAKQRRLLMSLLH